MKPALRILLTLFTILCSTTISGAGIEESQVGVVFEERCVLGEKIGFLAELVAPKTTGKFEIVPYSGQPTPTSWPGNRGFLGSSNKVTLEPGAIVDRYGFRGGTFVSPQGTPFSMRALPDSTLSKPFEAYRVRTALEVDGGRIAPAFGKPGLGTQYELPHSVDELIQLRVLEPVKP